MPSGASPRLAALPPVTDSSACMERLTNSGPPHWREPRLRMATRSRVVASLRNSLSPWPGSSPLLSLAPSLSASPCASGQDPSLVLLSQVSRNRKRWLAALKSTNSQMTKRTTSAPKKTLLPELDLAHSAREDKLQGSPESQ